MKKKKVYAGTVALAIAVGTIIPLGNYNINSSAYAAEIEDQKENNEELNSLIDEQSTIQDSVSYKNASKIERETYDLAINNAKNSSDTDNKDKKTLIDNIKTAKKNLGGNSYITYEDRQALSSTIAMAKKLEVSIVNKNISNEDKNRLTSAIDESTNILNNNEVDSSDIDNKIKI